MNSAGVRKIAPQFRHKVWGSWNTAPWFEFASREPSPEPLGEVCFPAGDLLVKFLFTAQDLSVQVHPGDDYARLHENSSGKTEMWHILKAEPGARIALGFKQQIGPARLEAAARSGEIMELLNWIEVHPGESYLIPSGTVHAIGAGISLVEIQQNSDVTYRLFDYGRPRELHLRPAMDVALRGRHGAVSLPEPASNGAQLLVKCPYFATYEVLARTGGAVGSGMKSRVLVVCEGTGKVAGQPARAGEVFLRTPATGEDLAEHWEVEPEANAPSGPMKLLLIS